MYKHSVKSNWYKHLNQSLYYRKAFIQCHITFCSQCLVIIDHYLSIHYCFFFYHCLMGISSLCLLVDCLYINCYQFKWVFFTDTVYILLYLIVNYLPHLCHLLIIQKHIFSPSILIIHECIFPKVRKTLVHLYMYTYNI